MCVVQYVQKSVFGMEICEVQEALHMCGMLHVESHECY